MLRKQKEEKPKPWCHGEYTNSIILRFLLLIALWVFYGLIPYTLPLESLHTITFILIAYDGWLWYNKESLMGLLILIALLLNVLLTLYITPGFNLFLTILITLILLFDIINTRSSASF